MPDVAPDLSVVILTCDRPRELELSLRSVLIQDVLPAQLVIVDDGALDPGLVEEWLEGTGIELTYHRKDRKGIARSRNIGAGLARGKLVMYLDDDERMEPGYIKVMVELFQEDRSGRIVGAAGDRVLKDGERQGRLDPLWAWLEKLFLLRGHGHRILSSGYNSPAWDSFTQVTDVAFLSGTATYRREVFETFSFDEELERFGPYAFGEDLAFSYKVQKLGACVVTPRARVTHHRSLHSRPPSATMARLRLCNQYYIYSRYFRGVIARPAAFAWATFGHVALRSLRFIAHPTAATWGAMLGTAHGAVSVISMALGRQPRRGRQA